MVGSSSGGWIKVIFMMNFASANLNRGEGRPAGQVKLLTYPTVILIAASGSATGLVLGWNSPIWRGPSIPPGESHGNLNGNDASRHSPDITISRSTNWVAPSFPSGTSFTLASG